MAITDARDFFKDKDKKKTSSRITDARDFFVTEDYLKELHSSVQTRLESWSNTANEFYNNVNDYYKNLDQSSYGLDSSKEWQSKASNSASWLQQESKTLFDFIKANKKYFDSEWVDNVLNSFMETNKTTTDIVNRASKDIDYWKQFKNESDYHDYYFGNKYKDYTYAEADEAWRKTEGKESDWIYKNLDNFKSSAELQAEIDALNKNYDLDAPYLEQALKHTFGDVYDLLDPGVNEGTREWAKNEKARLTELKGKATRRENYAKLTAEAENATDFDEYVKKGEDKGLSMENKWFQVDADGITIYDREYSDEIVASRNGKVVDSDSEVARLAKHMTDDQYNTYVYFLGKYGKKKANEYFKSIEETLNAKEAQVIANAWDIPVLDHLFNLYANVERWGDSMESIFSDEYKPASPVQMADQMLGADKTGIGKGLWDLGGNLAYQVPNILGGVAATYLLGPSGLGVMGATTAGTVGQLGLTGLSAFGSAKQEMLNLGYSVGQASLYGSLTAASEVALGAVIGKIGNVSGVWTDDAIKSLTKGVNSAGAKFAIEFGAGMASEGIEESLQEILDPFFAQIATGKKPDDLDWGQVAYAGLLGALSAGVMNGVGATANRFSNNNTAWRVQQKEGGVEALKKIGNSFSADTLAYKLASKVDENTSTWKLATLIGEMNGFLSEQNVADIKNALVKEGVRESDADTIAEYLGKAVDGENLTAMQRKALDSNPVLQRVFKKVIIDQNSTVNQRLNALMDVYGKEGHAGVDYSAIAKSQSKEAISDSINIRNFMESANKQAIKDKYGIGRSESYNAMMDSMVAEAKALSHNAKVNEGGTTIDSTTGKQIDIKKVKDAKAKMLELADGSIVNSKNVEYADDDEAILYETVLSKYDTATANAVINGFNAVKGMSVTQYLNGVDEAIEYGKIGYPMDKISTNGFYADLPDSMKKFAYNLGKDTAKAETESAQARVDKSKGKVIETRSGNVIIDEDIKNMTPRQEASITTLGKMVTDITHSNVHIFESVEKTIDGKKVRVFAKDTSIFKAGEYADNGFYDASTGDIYIDLHAGANAEGVILWTAAHELTHFIHQWSPAKFKVLADFLVAEYGKKGVDMRTLVYNKMAEAKRKKLTYEQAYEEVVADAMQSMFTDTDLASKVEKLKNKDKGLWNKIKQFFADLYKRITKEYDGLEAQTWEDYHVRQMGEKTIGRLSDLFAEALVDAGDTYANVSVEGVLTDITTSLPTESTETTAPGDMIQHSYRSFAEACGFEAFEDPDTNIRSWRFKGSINSVNEVTEHQIRNSPMGALINYSATKGYISYQDAKAQYEMFAKIANMCIKQQDFAQAMQFVGSMVFTGMKANADKQYKTTYDFPSICTKTQAIIDAMSEAMIKKGAGLTKAEIEALYRKVWEMGNPVPCPECYVFSRWVGIGGLLDNIKKYQDTYSKMTMAEVEAEYQKMKAEIEEFSKANSISFGKAKGKIFDLYAKEEAKLMDEIAKLEEAGDIVPQNKKDRLAKISLQKDTTKAMSWIHKVYFANENHTKVNPKYLVPNEVLFNLNAGETFATEYKEAWGFRTTQGAGYGKAITPYAEAVLGEGIAVTNNTTKTIKGKANRDTSTPKSNIFLEQNGTLSNDAIRILETARKKQLAQAFLGGQRLQSTSDARYENVTDYLIAAIEMQAMHSKAQVYTKVSGAVEAFNNWGFAINQSLMPLNSGLTKDGRLKDTSSGGMKVDVAYANRTKYENAGTITIGVNDNHIRTLFRDRGRDFIIPYHASGGDQTLIREFRRIQDSKAGNETFVQSCDYSKTQSEKELPTSLLRELGYTDEQIADVEKFREQRLAILTRNKEVDMDYIRAEGNEVLANLYDEFNGGIWDGVKLTKDTVGTSIFPNEYWDKSVDYDNSSKITEDYLEYCRRLGFLHKFSGKSIQWNKNLQKHQLVEVMGYNENGERVALTDLAYIDGDSTKGVEQFYWKTLTDRRMYGNDGKYLEQKFVTLGNADSSVAETFAKDNEGSVREYSKEKSDETLKTINVVDGKVTLADNMMFSERVTNKKTLDFLNEQIKRGEYITTYKSMRLDGYDANGNPILHSPMATEINGKYENEYAIGQWYQATEHPELIKFDKKNGLPYFELDKGVDEFGDDLGKVPARYNPYEHSSNYVINDQFKTAFKRSNLVVVEMRIPMSELTSGYQAQYAKDPVGWQEWKKGDVATALAKKGKERKVLLSRWAMPARVLTDTEVAQQYKELLSGTGVRVPNNVVTPSLLTALEEAGVEIDYNGITKFEETYAKKAKEREAKKAKEQVMFSERGSTIYIKDGHTEDGGTVDFINLILDGKKKGETRTHKNLTRKWVGIAKDGYVYGRVRFGEPYPITNKSPEYEESFIEGTEYDLKDGETKYYYPILEVEDFRNEPKPIEKNGNYGTYSFSERILMGSLFSGGGTLEAGLVYQMLDKEFAVEVMPGLAATYTDNHGKEHMFVGDVRDFDSKGKRNVFYLHASPVCKNFSPASNKGGETEVDIITAEATARILEEQMPQVFTVENVKRYIGSEAYNIITNKLTELGYKWDVDVYKASDYGNATKRERMIVRAVKDGELPAKPAKVANPTSWGEATRDLWETDLIPSNLVKSKIEAIRNTPQLKNLRLTKLDKPLLIYDTNKRKQVSYAWADELAPTLTTKCGDARIIMPDGIVYKPTPKFMGRIQGLPDNYKYPKATTNAFKIIGNGIPTQLTKAVIGGVLDSAYEQTHNGDILYSERKGNVNTEKIGNETYVNLTDFDRLSIAFLNALHEEESTSQDTSSTEVEPSVEDTNPTAFARARNLYREIINSLSEEFRKEAPTFDEWLSDVNSSHQGYNALTRLMMTITHNFKPMMNSSEYIKAQKAKDGLQKKVWELHDMRKDMQGDNYSFSERTDNAIDNRSLLVNALESVAQNDVEKSWLAKYKAQIADLNEKQNKLAEIRAEIQKTRFTKGADRSKLPALENTAKTLANQINKADKKLLELEASKALKGVVERERAKAYQLGKAKVDEYRKDRAVSTARNYYRPRMEKIVSDLTNRLEHPSAKTAIPEAFSASVAKVLSAFNFTTYDKDGNPRPTKANVSRAEAKTALETLATQLEQNSIDKEYGQLDIPPEMLEWIKSIVKVFEAAESLASDEFTINKMDEEQLKNTYKFLRSLQKTINNAGKYYTNAHYNVVSDATSTMNHLEPLPTQEKERGKKLSKMLAWDLASPTTVFDRFGEGGKHVFQMLIKGQSKEAYNIQTILDFVEKAYTEKEAKEWRETLVPVKISGKEYNVTVEYLMGLHCLLKQEDSRRHILEGGGIRFGDVTHNKKTTRFTNTFFTEADAIEVEKILDKYPRAREVADAMQKFMEETGSAWGNEVSMIRFGYHAFTIKGYYPIRTIKAGSDYEAQQKRANIYALLNKSFTKERTVEANNAVIVDGIFSVFNNHMSEMALYNAWAMPVIDAIKWFNYKESQDILTETAEKSVHESLRLAYGTKADEYVRRLFESINGQRSGGLSQDIAFDNLRKVNRVAVAGNVRVALQQPFSITRAFELIDPKYVTPLVGKARDVAYEEMLANSGIAKWKSLGYYDVNVSMPLQAKVFKNETFSDKATEKLMKAAEDGDAFTWTALWNACKKETAEKNKGISEAELLTKTAERFDDLVLRTQVVDSVLTKSQWMRADDFWHRATSSFMSEPIASYNALLRQYDNYSRDLAIHGAKYATKNNFKGMKRAVGIFVLTQLVNALVTAPLDALRDDDDYETYLEKLLANLKDNAIMNLLPTSMIPWIGDVVDYIKYRRTDRSDMAFIIKGVDLAQSIVNTIDNYSYYKLHNTFKQSLEMTSYLSGLPIANLWRDAVSIWNTVVSPLGYGELKFQTQEDKHSEGYKKMYEAIFNGNEDRAEELYGQLLSNGVEEDKIYNGLVNAVKNGYTNGDLSAEEAKERIKTIIAYMGKTNSDGTPITDNDIYWKIDKWEYTKDNGNSKGYSKYDDIFTAMEQGNPSEAIKWHIEDKTNAYLEEARAEAKAEGKSFNETKAKKEAKSKAESAVKSAITSYWKPKYKEAYKNKDDEEMKRIRYMLRDTKLYGTTSELLDTVKGWLKD